MPALQRFLAMLLADLRVRTRTARFWCVLAVMMVAAWWCLPGADAPYAAVMLWGGARGSFSSAWVGMVLAMAFTLLLNLGGFIWSMARWRDIETRVGTAGGHATTRRAYLLANGPATCRSSR
ncbi:MAG: hypothetical protein U1F19_00365 [Lysobacterales bacterium]